MEQERLQEGSWIVDKVYGEIGTVSRVFPDGVTAKFGNMVCIRKKINFELAPLDIQASDLKDMMELALETKDYEWAKSISQQMKTVKEAVR